MALEKQNVSISFAGGVSTKDDPKQVMGLPYKGSSGQDIPGKLLVLENGIFTSTNRIKKRFGYLDLNPAIDNTTSNITRGLGIATYKNELIEFTGEQIYSYSESIMKWSAKGTAVSLNVTANEIIRNSYQQTVQDSTIHSSGLQVYTWLDSSGGSKYAVIDSLTGQTIVQNQTLSATAIKAKPVSLGTYILLLYIDTVDSKIKYRAIPSAQPSTIGSPVTVSSTLDATNRNYDAMPFGARVFVAFNNNDAGPGGISVVFINQFLSLSATRDTTGENADSCITIFGDVTDNTVWVAYHNGAEIKYFIRDYNLTPIAVLGPTLVEANGNTIRNIAGLADNGSGEIFYTQNAVATYNAFVKRAYLTDAGVVTGVGVFLRSVGLFTKPLSYNSVTYVGLVHDSVNQPTYFLADDNQYIAAKFTTNNAGGLPTTNMLPMPQNFDTSKFLVPVLQKDLLTTISGAIYTQTGVSEVTFDFNASNTFFTSELGEDLHITGGILSLYDGVSVVEDGFNLFPEDVIVATSTTGGSVQDGQRQYSITYEWTDNQGQNHISAPSIPVTVTNSGGGTSTNTITIPTLRLTAKVPPRSPVVIGIYRTEAAGTLFYKISSITNPLFNDTTVDTVVYVDTVSDSAIIGNPLLYTTGGVVENIAPPATNLITTYKNRIILVPSESPLSFWYSKEVVPGVPVEFSDLFVQNIDQRGGDITAPAVLDDKLILFKRTSIFYVNGDGPDATGGNGAFSPAQLITSDGGCTDSKSVVSTPVGLMYKSEKGIYLLDRSLQVSYVGADVESFNSATITSSALVANTNQVRFTLDTGVALVYDYYFRQWSVFTNINSVDSTIFQNQFTYLRSNGTVSQETPDGFTDNNQFIKLRLTTAWLSFAGLQAFQRVYKLLLLGEYNSPHKLYVQVAYDFNSSATQEDYINSTALLQNPAYGESTPYGEESVYGSPYPLYQYRINLARQKCETIQFTIEDVQSSNYGEGLSLSAMAFEVGAKKGLNKIGSSRSFG